MKTLIRRNSNTNTGYELVSIDDNGKEIAIAIDKTYPGEPFTLVLPANEANRKYFNSKKVEAADGEIELAYKESKQIAHRNESTPRKGLEEWLEGDDKDTYLMLVAKAKANREAANKKQPMSDYEKALRAVERAQAKLAELQAQQNN